jgi:Ca2+/Na+ antiporter
MVALIIVLGLLVVGTGLLLLGADWFVDGAGDLARALGISALVVGVLLAGLEPEEMLTAAIASARGAPALAVGNVIGTNVTIVTAALGLSALISPMVIDRSVRRQALIATLVSLNWKECSSWLCLLATPCSSFGQIERQSSASMRLKKTTMTMMATRKRHHTLVCIGDRSC